MIKNLFNTSTHASNTLNSFKMLNKSISSLTKIIALSIGHLGNWAASADDSMNEPLSSVMQLTEKLIESFQELSSATESAQMKLQVLKQKEDYLKQLRSKHSKDYKKSRFNSESNAEQNIEAEIAQRELEFKRDVQSCMKDIMLAIMKGLEVMSQRVMIISAHGASMFECMDHESLQLSAAFNKQLCDALRNLRSLNAPPESEEDKIIAKPLHPQRIDTTAPSLPPRNQRRFSTPTLQPITDAEVLKMRRKSEVPTPPLRIKDSSVTNVDTEFTSFSMPIMHQSLPTNSSDSMSSNISKSYSMPPTLPIQSNVIDFKQTKAIEPIPFFFPEKVRKSTLCRKASIANVSEGLPKSFSFQDFEIGDIVTATANYEGLNSDEHDLIVGDTLEISLLYDDGWAVGPCYRTGLSGLFPLDMVKRIGSTTQSFRPRIASPKDAIDNPLRIKIPSEKPMLVQSPVPGDSSDDSIAPMTPDKSFFPERNTSKSRRSICIQKATLLGLEKLN